MRNADWRRVIVTTLMAGLVAGLLDVFAAAAINHAAPVLILKFIASGALGAAALKGGDSQAVLGLALQEAMSAALALGYLAVGGLRPGWLRRPLGAGAVFGLLTFGLMNLVVVPLSRAPHGGAHPPVWILLNIVAMLVFGWIIAFGVRIGLAAADRGDARPAAISA